MTTSRARLAVAVLAVATLAACGGAKAGAGGTAPVASAGPAPEPVHAPEFTAGLAAFDQGDFAGARTKFEAASKSNPNDYEALWNLGQSCEKLGDVPAAAAAY